MISCSISKRKYSQQSNSFSFFTTKNRKMWCVIWPLKDSFFFLQDELAQTSLPAWRSSPGKNSREFCNIFLQEDLLQVYHALSAINTFEIQTCDEENLIKSHSSESFCIFHPDINSVICLNPTKFSIQKKGNLGSSVYLLWIQTFLYILYRFR